MASNRGRSCHGRRSSSVNRPNTLDIAMLSEKRSWISDGKIDSCSPEGIRVDG